MLNNAIEMDIDNLVILDENMRCINNPPLKGDLGLTVITKYFEYSKHRYNKDGKIGLTFYANPLTVIIYY
jgi:hypothetical protein